MNEKTLNPGSLLEMSGYYWRTCALHAAVKLDTFTAIGDEGADAGAVAERLGCDRRALTMLLNALCALDLLKKTGDRYENQELASMFLSKSSPRYVGYIIMHHHHLMESWSRLDESVKSGAPIGNRIDFSDAEIQESFLMGMFNMAMSIAPGLAPTLDLAGRKRLLDLGGGPGTFAIHFCMSNPELTAAVYDLPTTRPFAQKTIDEFGMSDRVGFVECDFLESKIEETFDVAWLSHILHGEGPEDCRMIIEKAVSALAPGGSIFVHDFYLNDAGDGPLFPALFSMNMLLGTDRGQSYSEREVREMLADTGVREIERLPFTGPTESGILKGTV